MDMRLRLGDKISINENFYKVIGIDYYSLKNLYGESKQWISYTLQGKSRIWITQGIDKGYYLWNATNIKNVKKNNLMKIRFDYSGIAFIKFRGQRGFSEPLAELFIFEREQAGRSLFAIERFIKKYRIKTYYYVGQRINILKCLKK
jgi:hypothetical protein